MSLLLALALISAIAIIQGAEGQAATPNVAIEDFQLAPGESQTRQLTMTFQDVTEVTVTRVDFGDEMARWASVEGNVPFSVRSSPDTINDLLLTVPITVAVPSSYEGDGGKISAHIDLEYELNGQRNAHAVVHEFGVNVGHQSDAWPLFGIGAAIAATGAAYGFYRQRKRKVN